MAEVKEKRGPSGPKGVVRVSSANRKVVFVDLTKHLLAGGEPHVELTALGSTISDCVAVAEMLKNQGMVEVKKIHTSRNVENARRTNTDKISIVVVKSKGFDAKYAEFQKAREEKKLANEKEKAEAKA